MVVVAAGIRLLPNPDNIPKVGFSLLFLTILQEYCYHIFMGAEPTEQEAANANSTPQVPESASVSQRRNPLKRAGTFAAGLLGISLALGAASGVAATEKLPQNPHPLPAATEQPSATPPSGGEHLVPVPPENCDVPWQPNTSIPTHEPEAMTPNIILDSMRKPQIEPTPGTKPECWQLTPDNPQAGTQNTQPETPPVNVDTKAKEA